MASAQYLEGWFASGVDVALDGLSPPLEAVGLAFSGFETWLGRESPQEVFKGIPGMIIFVHQFFGIRAVHGHLIRPFLVAQIAKLPDQFFAR